MNYRNRKLILTALIVGFILAGSIIWYFWDSLFPQKEQFPTVAINNCSSIEPQFIKVAEGEMVVFINEDSADHTLKFIDISLVVPAGKENSMVATLAYGPGTYTYDCDNTRDAAQLQIEALSNRALAKTELDFKQIYDSLNSDTRECVKDVLKEDFEAVYNHSESFSPSIYQLTAMNDCFNIPQENINE